MFLPGMAIQVVSVDVSDLDSLQAFQLDLKAFANIVTVPKWHFSW